MAKYSKDFVEKICDLMAADDYTVEELCLMMGVSESTFFQWKKDKPEFLEALKKAEEKRLSVFRKAARSGLLTLLQGKEYEEVTSEFAVGKRSSKPVKVFEKKVRKFILPNPTSVIFALKNLDPDNFKDVIKQEVTGKDGGPVQNEVRHTVVFKKYGQGDQS